MTSAPAVPFAAQRAKVHDMVVGLMRYGLVGVANAATYYGTYLLVLPRAGYLVAHTVGLGVAMVVSFLLNCRFTFRVRPTWTRFLLYPASQVVNIAATTVGVVGLVHLGIDERLAPLVAAALALPASFVAARFLITRAVTLPGERPGPVPSREPTDWSAWADAVTGPVALPDRR